MNWQDYIVSNSAILGGKPVIKDTRLSVEFILDRLADGWTEGMLLENFSPLTHEALQAVYAFSF